MAGVFKRITAKSITRHTAHKEYDITFSQTSSAGFASASFDGVFAGAIQAGHDVWNATTNIPYEYSSSDFNAINDSLSDFTSTGNQDLFNTIRSKFYKHAFTPGQTMPLIYESEPAVIEIPRLMIGDGIKPGTVEILDGKGGLTYTDDGKGNIIHPTHADDFKDDNLIFQLFTGNTATYPKGQHTIHDINTAPSQVAKGRLHNVEPVYRGKQADSITQVDWVGYTGDQRYKSGYIFSQSNAVKKFTLHTPERWSTLAYTGVHSDPDHGQDLSTFSVAELNMPPSMQLAGPATFDGLTIWMFFKYDKSYANAGEGGSRFHTLFTLGDSSNMMNDVPGTNSNSDSMLFAFFDEDGPLRVRSTKNGQKKQSATTATIGDGDFCSLCVRVTPSDFKVKVDFTNHSSGQHESRQATLGQNYIHNAIKPDNLTLTVGSGVTTLANSDKVYHTHTGMVLYDLRVWDTPLSDTAADGLCQNSIEKIGNVFYDEGVIVLDASNTSIQLSEAQLGFKNNVDRDEYEYVCMVQDNEFNMSQNPTIIETGSLATNPVPKSFVSSGDWDPYVTTIGLYNDHNELLAIGKLGRPIRKVEHYDQTFVVKWDK